MMPIEGWPNQPWLDCNSHHPRSLGQAGRSRWKSEPEDLPVGKRHPVVSSASQLGPRWGLALGVAFLSACGCAGGMLATQIILAVTSQWLLLPGVDWPLLVPCSSAITNGCLMMPGLVTTSNWSNLSCDRPAKDINCGPSVGYRDPDNASKKV